MGGNIIANAAGSINQVHGKGVSFVDYGWEKVAARKLATYKIYSAVGLVHKLCCYPQSPNQYICSSWTFSSKTTRCLHAVHSQRSNGCLEHALEGHPRRLSHELKPQSLCWRWLGFLSVRLSHKRNPCILPTTNRRSQCQTKWFMCIGSILNAIWLRLHQPDCRKRQQYKHRGQTSPVRLHPRQCDIHPVFFVQANPWLSTASCLPRGAWLSRREACLRNHLRTSLLSYP